MKLFKILPFLLLVACQNQEIKMKAKQNVSAYVQPDASSKQADFVIQQGQICFLGKDVYGKVDKFIAVRCENGLKGFVLERNDFEIMP